MLAACYPEPSASRKISPLVAWALCSPGPCATPEKVVAPTAADICLAEHPEAGVVVDGPREESRGKAAELEQLASEEDIWLSAENFATFDGHGASTLAGTGAANTKFQAALEDPAKVAELEQLTPGEDIGPGAEGVGTSGGHGASTLAGAGEADTKFQAELEEQQEGAAGRGCEAARKRAKPDREKAAYLRKIRCFLATSGFTGVNVAKRTGLGMFSKSFLYPLHAAVRANDSQAIEALLWAGGDRSKEDSQKCTALALARKLNRRNSHSKVIEILSAAENEAAVGGPQH